MRTLRCLIVDDEPLALSLLTDNIRQVPFLELVRCCDDGYEALEALRTETPDILFLDIQMPGLMGTQLLHGLTHRPLTVFVTAYEQYALQGFNLHVFDYLLKPVRFERFLQTAQRAYDALVGPDTKRAVTAPSEDFFVHADYALVRIRFDSILYVEGLKDYVKIYTTTQPRPIVSRMSVKAMEERLPSDQFLRTHRSYIVALSKINSIRKLRLQVGVPGGPSTSVPVSESYQPQLLTALNLPSKF